LPTVVAISQLRQYEPLRAVLLVFSFRIRDVSYAHVDIYCGTAGNIGHVLYDLEI